jgi:6-pyruvoyl-tetrahydropterin synthase
MLEIKSTKAYHKLPVSHMQWFDTDETNEPCTGPCSKWHGYDRSIIFEFSGPIDEHGWIVGFGQLKSVKSFLEFYFDHTALASADDPRMSDILAARDAGIVDLRVLPYGVSMEMSSLFIWEQVNPYILDATRGRVYVSKVECREHDSNSAFIMSDRNSAVVQSNEADYWLTKQKQWDFVNPKTRMTDYN